MRKILLFLFGSTLMFPCCTTHPTETQSSIINTDSINNAQREKARLDSLREIEMSSIVWGSIKFGESMSEVLNNNALGSSLKESNGLVEMIPTEVDNFRKSVGLETHINEFHFNFRDSGLVALNVKSWYVEKQDISQLTSDCDIWIKEFSKKYGEPSFKKQYVYSSDFTDDEYFTYGLFKLKYGKKIFISLGKEIGRHYYWVSIYNDEIEKAYKEKRYGGKPENSQEIINNSF